MQTIRDALEDVQYLEGEHSKSYDKAEDGLIALGELEDILKAMK